MLQVIDAVELAGPNLELEIGLICKNITGETVFVCVDQIPIFLYINVPESYQLDEAIQRMSFINHTKRYERSNCSRTDCECGLFNGSFGGTGPCIKKIKQDFNLTTIFISHNLRLVRDFSDKIVIMYQGKIVEEGRAQSVLQSPSHPYTQQLLQAAFYKKYMQHQ